MFWIITISIIIAFLLWILLVPVIIRVHTGQSRYQVALPGIFKASVVPGGSLFRLKFRVFFIPFYFDPFKERKSKPEEKKQKPKKRKKRGPGIRSFRAILGSFWVKTLNLNLDTEDVMMNAWLIPLFSTLNNEQVHMQVNYQGQASLDLDLRTRLGGMLWILMRNR